MPPLLHRAAIIRNYRRGIGGKPTPFGVVFFLVYLLHFGAVALLHCAINGVPNFSFYITLIDY